MIIPKARQLPSGNWTIQLRLNGKSITGTFASEDEAKVWAASYKETHSKSNFTTAAKQLARENGVALLNRKYLIKLIKRYIETLKSIYNQSQWEDFLNGMELLPNKTCKGKSRG